jgi:hypothetical protein
VHINAEGAAVTRHRDAVAQRKPLVLAVSWLIFTVVLVAVTIGLLFIARDFIAHHAGWYILGATRTQHSPPAPSTGKIGPGARRK